MFRSIQMVITVTMLFASTATMALEVMGDESMAKMTIKPPSTITSSSRVPASIQTDSHSNPSNAENITTDLKKHELEQQISQQNQPFDHQRAVNTVSTLNPNFKGTDGVSINAEINNAKPLVDAMTFGILNNFGDVSMTGLKGLDKSNVTINLGGNGQR